MTTATSGDSATTTPAPEINRRMPFMTFNWNDHDARTGRLSLEERGMFDLVRCALWKVVGCRMQLDHLKVRLRCTPHEEELLGVLLSLDLLRVDDKGRVYDEVQVAEFAAAVAKSVVNTANGRKGGRPRRAAEPEESPNEPSTPQSNPEF